MSRDYRSWVEETINSVFKTNNLKPALEALVSSLTSLYPGSKVWVVEKYGKRESFIAGSGDESYQPAKKISITDNYNLFLQDFPEEEDKQILELITALFKIVIISYSNNDLYDSVEK